MTGQAEGASKAKGKGKENMSTSMDISSRVQRQARKFFRLKTLHQRLPITEWLPKYNLEMLEGDVMAGITVGLTVIPQGIAYALVAGLEPSYGLYSAFMGCFVYVFLGSCKEISIGPTAIMSIMTHEYSPVGSPDYAVLLCFISGVIILMAGICNLGFLITFISKPVISGFTSAAAITIATSQLKGLFGLSFSSEGFIDTLEEFFTNIVHTKWQDLTLGLSCAIILLLMRKLKDLKSVKPQPHDSSGTRAWKKALFLVSVGRNAIIVIVAAIIAAALNNDQPFTITGEVTPGLPSFQPPPFHTTFNGTYFDFSEMMSQLGAGIGIIPMISILESIAIGSAFAKGKTLDATQEMIALGACNIMGSFVKSYPITGSFSRTAVNSTSGVKTPAGGIITGLLVVLALAFLTPYFKFIPKASLSAVIICAVIFMVEYEHIVPVWRVRKLDQLCLWGTFLSCLFWKLEYGILVGVMINIGILLFTMARPKVAVTAVAKQHTEELKYVEVTPRSGLYFPSVDHVRSKVTKAALQEGQGNHTVVVNCAHFAGVDFTASKGMKSMCTDFERRQQGIVFSNVTPGVERGLKALNQNLKVTRTAHELSELAMSFTSGVVTNGGTSVDSQDTEATDPLLQSTNGTKPVIVPKANM